MAERYEITRGINRLTSAMARLEIGRTRLMTTIGRRSGEARHVPVGSIAVGGIECVVSP